MSSFNLVVLMGNLTRDPEVRATNSGSSVCEIGLAVNDRVKKGDEWVDEATFVDIVCFGRTADNVAQYLKKGSSCLVEGRLKLDQWTQDGQKRSKLRVICQKLQFTGGKPGGSQSGQQSQQTHEQRDAPVYGDEDIPF